MNSGLLAAFPPATGTRCAGSRREGVFVAPARSDSSRLSRGSAEGAAQPAAAVPIEMVRTRSRQQRGSLLTIPLQSAVGIVGRADSGILSIAGIGTTSPPNSIVWKYLIEIGRIRYGGQGNVLRLRCGDLRAGWRLTCPGQVAVGASSQGICGGGGRFRCHLGPMLAKYPVA